MNLTISGHHLEVTPALRSYVTNKLDRITRHFDQVVDVKVLLSIENQKEKEGRQRAECNIHVKGNDMFAESSHHDLYAAVDELVDKLDRQVVRYKDKLQDHHHATAKRHDQRAALEPAIKGGVMNQAHGGWRFLVFAGLDHQGAGIEPSCQQAGRSPGPVVLSHHRVGHHQHLGSGLEAAGTDLLAHRSQGAAADRHGVGVLREGHLDRAQGGGRKGHGQA